MKRLEVDPLLDLTGSFGPIRSGRAQLRQPWEEGTFAFLSQSPSILREVQEDLFELPAHVPRPLVAVNAQAVAVPAPFRAPPLRCAHTGWQASRAREERQVALSKWSALIRQAPHFFSIQVLHFVMNQDNRVELGNLEVIFCRKATNTLLSRAGALKKLVVWGVFRFPMEALSEPLLFLFMQELKDKGASASAGHSVLQALAFCHGLLGLAVALDSLRSPRVTGMAHLQLQNKRPPKQAQPLTVQEVRWLEQAAAQDPQSYESLLAGGLCFMLFARARHSDACRAKDLAFDFGARTFTTGYVECAVLNPKQSRAASQGNRLLPMAAPVLGLEERPWALSWTSARQAWGLTCAGDLADDFILPAMSANGRLLQAHLTSAEVTRWLRAILSQDPRANQDHLLQLTSHSLKVTLLSWTAKVFVGWDNQTLLGYHSLGVNKSALSYSRDALSGPLRELEKVLTLVRAGQFDPDDTRSGRWHPVPQASSSSASAASAAGDAAEALQQALQESSEGSDSEGSVSSSGSENGQLQVNEATHLLSLIVESGRFALHSHASSGITHVVESGFDRFLCGRSVYGRYQVVQEVSGQDLRLCFICNNGAEAKLNGAWAGA